MKKNIFFLFIISLLFFNLQAQCPSVFDFATQSSIDNFATEYPNCTIVEGNLLIDGVFEPENIMNLEGLSQIKEVTGSLIITRTELWDLTGLENLTEVGSELVLGANDYLNDLTALGNMNMTGENSRIYLYANTNLPSLAGLEQLTKLHELSLSENFILSDLSGLSNIDSIGSILLEYNNIENFSDLTALSHLEVLDIENEDNLTGLTGLELIESMNRIGLKWCHELTDLTGLNNLDSVYQNISINQCNGLVSLEGLNNLRTVGSFGVRSCPEFTSFSGLENLERLRRGGFLIRNLPQLENLTGLEGLVEIDNEAGTGGGMSIISNHNLLTLTGLNNLLTLSGSMNIDNNNGLVDLTGLENLEYIGTDLRIKYNDGLESLNGLGSLERVEEGIEIFHNDALISVAGMTAMTNTNSIWLMNNESLETLEGFEGISSIDSTLQIGLNENLKSTLGCQNITSVGSFVIGGSPELTTLIGAQNLKIITNSLVLVDLGITNMIGLDSLENIGGKVWIRDNPSLVSLEGFGAPAGIFADTIVEISGNSNLSMCAVETVCNRIYSEYPLLIEDNAEGCNSIPEVEAVCDSLATISSTEKVLFHTLDLSPNPASSYLSFDFAEDTGSYAISDMRGRVLQRGELKAGDTVQQLSLIDLLPGVYLLRIQGEDVYVGKFIAAH